MDGFGWSGAGKLFIWIGLDRLVWSPNGLILLGSNRDSTCRISK